MPLVEAQYRVQKEASGRAIAGLSMGGYQSLAIGLNHTDLFDYVGAFSSALQGNFNAVVGDFMGDADAANANLKLLWLGCGTDDSLLQGNQNFEQSLSDAGIKHEWTATPDYAHQWTLWRTYLYTLAPKLFKDAG